MKKQLMLWIFPLLLIALLPSVSAVCQTINTTFGCQSNPSTSAGDYPYGAYVGYDNTGTTLIGKFSNTSLIRTSITAGGIASISDTEINISTTGSGKAIAILAIANFTGRNLIGEVQIQLNGS